MAATRVGVRGKVLDWRQAFPASRRAWCFVGAALGLHPGDSQPSCGGLWSDPSGGRLPSIEPPAAWSARYLMNNLLYKSCYCRCCYHYYHRYHSYGSAMAMWWWSSLRCPLTMSRTCSPIRYQGLRSSFHRSRPQHNRHQYRYLNIITQYHHNRSYF